MEQETKNAGRQARDGDNTSLWQDSAGQNHVVSPVPQIDQIYDTLIVGAGITGLTTALLLQKAGKKCIIAEAHEPGFGTTGGTSAHINTFADTSFDQVEKDFDLDTSKLFAESIADSVALISENVAAYQIDCDFEWKQAFLYAETEKEAKELESLYQGVINSGVKVDKTESVPTKAIFENALVFPGQAQFHPLKYLAALLEEFVKSGGIIRENTLIDGTEIEGDYHICNSAKGIIKARNVVYATHIPPGGINILHFRCAPYRSYVIAATLKDESYPADLIYDMQDPYHYIRTHVVDGQQYVVAGGHDHKTGHGDPQQSFADLEAYLRSYYEVDQVVYRWSSQYYVPADGLPYIGKLPGAADGIFAATGFNGNGMNLGTISAIALSELILTGRPKYEDIFSPARIKPIAGFTEMVKESADVAFRFIADRFEVEKIPSLAEMQNGTGQVVKYQDQKVAIYKDNFGVIHALNPVCTHAKCIVAWNTSEKSWDCPCHGARFDCDGHVLTGPAREDLEKIELRGQK